MKENEEGKKGRNEIKKEEKGRKGKEKEKGKW